MAVEIVDSYLQDYLDRLGERAESSVVEAIRYSLLGGGKRFRPLLAVRLAEAFGVAPQKVLPWAAAIEMIHTYSLIHDDLPCMDDDDLRRGQPTNHKKFGEAIALLAGDSLISEAFLIVAENYQEQPEMALQLIRLLASSIGPSGMVGGQALDLRMQANTSFKELLKIHELKTGALIKCVCAGTGLVLGLMPEKRILCETFGKHLGLAFQLKDDLLDADSADLTASIEDELMQASSGAKAALQSLGVHSSSELSKLVEFNLSRQH